MFRMLSDQNISGEWSSKERWVNNVNSRIPHAIHIRLDFKIVHEFVIHVTTVGQQKPIPVSSQRCRQCHADEPFGWSAYHMYMLGEHSLGDGSRYVAF